MIILAQVQSAADWQQNLIKAEAMIKESKSKYQAQMVVFPEYFMSSEGLNPNPNLSQNQAAQSQDGPFVQAMSALAKKHQTWLIFGINEYIENDNHKRTYNTIIILDNDGQFKAKYRKTHLFDAFNHQESAYKKAGDQLFKPLDTPFGKLGLFVCYELRFPEIARNQFLAGAEIMIIPAAWYQGNLKSDHFINLAKARAIENSAYILACNQTGENFIGQSLAIDPMGIIIAAGSEQEGLIPCPINLNRVKETRKKLPNQRRPNLYNL